MYSAAARTPGRATTNESVSSSGTKVTLLTTKSVAKTSGSIPSTKRPGPPGVRKGTGERTDVEGAVRSVVWTDFCGSTAESPDSSLLLDPKAAVAHANIAALGTGHRA